MVRKGIITPGIVALALAFLGVSAHADIVRIDSITDGWQNPVGGSSVSINNSLNPGADRITWGEDRGNGQSGYLWDSRDTWFDVTTGVAFVLGQFTHINEAIAGGSGISSVDLSLVLGNFVSPASIGGKFTFNHDETSNVEPGCCNDLVTISHTSFNTPFTDNGGTAYYFTLLGFSTNGGATILDSFSTVENQKNQADLYAIITTTPVNPVPEPTSLLLLGTGIAGALRARRRRQR